MELEPRSDASLSGSQGAEGVAPAVAPGQALGGGLAVNETAELVLDLLSHTALVQPDTLALVRGRTAEGGSVTDALVQEGAAPADGIARMLAVRHHLPVVDLVTAGVAADAAQLIPVHTLERGSCCECWC